MVTSFVLYAENPGIIPGVFCVLNILIKYFQVSYKFLLTSRVSGCIIYMTDKRRCCYGIAMLRKIIIPKIMRLGIIISNCRIGNKA